jgi:hypothetical protein
MAQMKMLRGWVLMCALAAVSGLFTIRPEVYATVAQVQAQSRQLNRQTDSITTWPSKAKRWALVIGVDQYRDGQINALKGSVNDAHNLANALVRYAGFPQDQVVVLTTDQQEERQPTRINILTYLSNLASLVPKDGLLLVSFAGHGIERGGQAYLIPSDARLSHDVSLLEESAVSVTRMHDRIKAIGVGQVIVLLDACRNDPGGRADAPNNMSAAYTKFNFDVGNREVQAFATFYATAIGQRAYEYTEKRQGYFTWAIVEGLKGEAANEKGEVTLAGLLKYVQDNVPKRIAIDLGASEQQKPFAIIEGYRADELVIAISEPSAGNVGTASTVSSLDPAAIELSFWDTIKSSHNPADFKLYLDKYPSGAFAQLAKLRIEPRRNSGAPPLPRHRAENTGPDGHDGTGVKLFLVFHSHSIFTQGELLVSPAGLTYKETGDHRNTEHDFIIPCSAVRTVNINKTIFRNRGAVLIKYSLKERQKEINLFGRIKGNNRPGTGELVKNAILVACGIGPG